MPLSVLLLIGLGVAAFALAVSMLVAARWRRAVVSRALAGDAAATHPARGVLIGREKGTNFSERLLELTPSAWANDPRMQERLVHAGYDDPAAPYVYALVRLGVLVTLPLLVLLIAPKNDVRVLLFLVTWGAIGGWILPIWYVARKESRRQDRLRRSIPDALDLLVVCVEAGISLDAAILRVAREMQLAHPELAREFLIINRKTNAGMVRDEALRGIWVRTGVEEVRALVSAMIQSEKWGTSIAKVLRVYAETLRRKRRQIIEKKAATAPMKMLFPLIFFIFPAMFVVVFGAAVLNVMQFLRTSF